MPPAWSLSSPLHPTPPAFLLLLFFSSPSLFLCFSVLPLRPRHSNKESHALVLGVSCRIIQDPTALPPEAATAEEDESLFQDDPWVDVPIKMDYGYNVK